MSLEKELDSATNDDLKSQLLSLRKENQLLGRRLEKLSKQKSHPKVKVATSRSRKKGDFVRCLAGDIHGMKHDPLAVAAWLSDIKTLDPDEVIILGDYIDCGGFLSEYKAQNWVDAYGYSYEEDVAATNAILDALQTAAPRAKIEIIEGNHEDRVERWAITKNPGSRRDANMLLKAVSPEFLCNLKGRGIKYYRRGEIHNVPNEPGWIRKGKVLMTHRAGTSRHAAAQSVSQAGASVFYADTHRADTAWIKTPGGGQHGAWNFGCLCQAGRPLWARANFSHWTQGHGVQFVSRNENFLVVPVPIIDGKSLLLPLLKK
jgi:hypothetical protein